MRLATYRRSDGTTRVCAVSGDAGAATGFDISDASDGRLPSDMTGLIGLGPQGWEQAAATIAAATTAGAQTTAGAPAWLADLDLVAPIPRPPKLIAAAGNYQAHIVEGGLPPVDKDRIVPKLFLKPSTTIAGPGEPVALPSVSPAVDWELELAIVIGRTGKDIALDQALDHVFGYTVINDISARRMDWGVPDREPGGMDGFFDWLNGKWPDGFAPMGPWIVTSDEIADPDALQLRLEVNGQVRQQASTGEMIFSCAELISFASRIMRLEPGDVIATGTPAGVGDTTGEYLSPGDVMSGWIEGIGTLDTTMVAADTDVRA